MNTVEDMETRIVSIELPLSEYNFLKTLSKKMGWVTKIVKTKKHAKTELEEALDEAHNGKLKSFDNVDDFMNYLNS